MLPNSSADFARFVKFLPVIQNYFKFTPIPDKISQLVDKIPIVFTNVDRDMLSVWLWSYFWPYYLFREQIALDVVLEMKPVELGGGIGLLSLIMGGTNQTNSPAILDLPVSLHLQDVVEQLLGTHGISAPYIYRASDFGSLYSHLTNQNHQFFIYSYWAFSEFPLELRDQVFPLFDRSEFTLFAANSSFSNVENGVYFKQMAARIPGKQLYQAPIDWHPLGGHTYYLIK